MFGSLVYVVLGIIEFLVGFRFLFLLLGANPGSAFVHWIYTWSAPFAAPFSGIFGQHVVTTGQGAVVSSVFDWTALIALIVYAFIGVLLGNMFGHRRAVIER